MYFNRLQASGQKKTGYRQGHSTNFAVVIFFLFLSKYILSAASSSEIRSALDDKALQELICNIDCSPNAENVSISTQMLLSSKISPYIYGLLNGFSSCISPW